MVRVPSSRPTLLGVNVTTMVQCPPGNNGLEVEQVPLLVTPKSLRLVVILENFTLVFRVLVQVTVCVWLVVNSTVEGKINELGRHTTGSNPSPDNVIVCGLFGALSVMVMAPVRVSIAVGVKVTDMVQLPPPALTEVPQLLVWSKSPEATMLVTLRAPFPGLVKVTLWEPLVAPTSCGSNVRPTGERLTEGTPSVSEIFATNAS
jgi:hypothetical protein